LIHVDETSFFDFLKGNSSRFWLILFLFVNRRWWDSCQSSPKTNYKSYCSYGW
jgi:hypothetical protein